MSKQFNYEDRVSTAWSAWMATPGNSYAAFTLACDKAFGDLAPRLTDAELEAKCKALAASIDEKWEELHRQWQAKAASLEVAERERDALAARVRELEDELKTFVAVRVDRIEKEKMRDMHRRMLSETVAAFTEAIDSLHRFYGKKLAELEARNG